MVPLFGTGNLQDIAGSGAEFRRLASFPEKRLPGL
jgi:hypothetical protein